MFPGMGNPAQMGKLMKQMGIKTEEINAKKIIIETDDGNLVFTSPQVTKMTIQGTDTYQVVGEAEHESTGSKISDEDIKMVMDQAGVPEAKAKEALEEFNGDIAEAILSFKD